MQRHQTSLAELGAANRQHRRLQVNILKLDVARFADYLINTDGEKSATLAQVHDVFADLKSLAGAVHA